VNNSERLAIIFLLLGTLSALVLVGCGGDDTSRDQEAIDQATGKSVGGDVGDLAPSFQLLRLDGSKLALGDLRGKAVLVDFWATWCPPCRMALPHLQELSAQYSEQLVIVGIALDQGGARVVAPFVEREGVTFEIVLPDANNQVARDFGGIASIPTSFLVDPEGRIAAKWIGYKTKAEYEGAIRRVLDL